MCSHRPAWQVRGRHPRGPVQVSSSGPAFSTTFLTARGRSVALGDGRVKSAVQPRPRPACPPIWSIGVRPRPPRLRPASLRAQAPEANVTQGERAHDTCPAPLWPCLPGLPGGVFRRAPPGNRGRRLEASATASRSTLLVLRERRAHSTGASRDPCGQQSRGPASSLRRHLAPGMCRCHRRPAHLRGNGRQTVAQVPRDDRQTAGRGLRDKFVTQS